MSGRRASWWFDSADIADPRRWAAPAGHGVFDGIQLDYLDADDEDDRTILVEAEHPEMARALARGRKEMTIHGEVVNPRLHLALHRVVGNRLYEQAPTDATWPTAQRLSNLGYERHVVLHMLMSVLSDELYAALRSEPLPAEEELRQRLDHLPESWPPPVRARAH